MKCKNLSSFVAILLSLFFMNCSDGNDAFLKIGNEKMEYVFDCNGGYCSIPINSNYSYTSKVLSGEYWCHIEQVVQQVKVNIDPLVGGDTREALIQISSSGCEDKIIKITQNVITVINAPKKVSISNNNKTFSLEIASGTELVFETDSWINIKDFTWQSGTKTYLFEADNFANSEKELREGFVNIKAKDNSINFEYTVPVEQWNYTNEAIKTLNELYKTDALNSKQGTNRYDILGVIDTEYSVALDDDQFRAYLKMNSETAVTDENNNPILSCYRYAFNKVISEVKSTTPEQGTTAIWHLYNMGFIVKTPSVCFGIDLNHRLAAEFAPYIDFLCVTHADSDHVSNELMVAMTNSNKPVLSNFYKAGGKYYSTNATSVNLNGVDIKTAITNHDPTKPNYTTCFRIKLGEDSGNFDLMHVGDSSFEPEQYIPVEGGDPSLLVLRSGNKAEVNILGTGHGQVNPKNIFFSHLIELRHKVGVSPMRATILGAIDNMKNFPGRDIIVPFWGEKFIWKDSKIVDDTE